MSEIKSNKLSPRKGTTQTIGDSGDTITVSSGATLDIQGNYSGINTISWDTTAKTADFTAETNRGYFIDTTSASVTITLPASPVAGSFIGIKDYALTADTNSINIDANGNKIQGSTDTFILDTEGGAVNLVYVDSTQGWLTFDSGQSSDITNNSKFVTATGGTVTTCGDFKIHTFTGPGTFSVSCAGNSCGSNTVDYLVIAGGGGGGGRSAGVAVRTGSGGGAGGYRESSGAASGCYSTSPLGACVSALPVSVQGYPITVGGGGSRGSDSASGGKGANSVFSTITSTGGGAGGQGGGGSGGSGGGAGADCGSNPAGAGNTPPVSPPQGQNGGPNGGSTGGAGGGGSSGEVGGTGTSNTGGDGGDGVSSSINASATTRAAGGGGGGSAQAGSGGTGGGGNGGHPGAAGTTNTGSGGGGGGGPTSPPYQGGAGGSGIVIIRYKFQ